MMLLLKDYYKEHIDAWLSKHGENVEDYHLISMQGTEELLGFIERTFAKNLNFREDFEASYGVEVEVV
jgi:hypothetical protein